MIPCVVGDSDKLRYWKRMPRLEASAKLAVKRRRKTGKAPPKSFVKTSSVGAKFLKKSSRGGVYEVRD